VVELPIAKELLVQSSKLVEVEESRLDIILLFFLGNKIFEVN